MQSFKLVNCDWRIFETAQPIKQEIEHYCQYIPLVHFLDRWGNMEQLAKVAHLPITKLEMEWLPHIKGRAGARKFGAILKKMTNLHELIVSKLIDINCLHFYAEHVIILHVRSISYYDTPTEEIKPFVDHLCCIKLLRHSNRRDQTVR